MKYPKYHPSTGCFQISADSEYSNTIEVYFVKVADMCTLDANNRYMKLIETIMEFRKFLCSKNIGINQSSKHIPLAWLIQTNQPSKMNVRGECSWLHEK